MSAALANPIHEDRSLRTKSLCQSCGGEHKAGLQLWDCVECGAVRVWGWMHPEDKMARPLLNCEGCEEATRHVFLGIAGVTV